MVSSYYCSIGAACISLQYDAMLQRFQSIGIHVAVSSISRGKTNCAKVALAAVGNYPKGYTIYLTDSLARSYLGGALPFIYDDPSSDRVLKPLPLVEQKWVLKGSNLSQDAPPLSLPMNSSWRTLQKLTNGNAHAHALFIYY